MPKTKKKKTPVTLAGATHASGSSSNPQSSRNLIRQFHVLLKRKTFLEKAHSDGVTENEAALREVEEEINSLGGLAAYQRMSKIGQGNDRGGGSEKVLIQWLKDLSFHVSPPKKHKLLEVGALKPDNYHSCISWLEVTPMDLRSTHPSILQQDFLQMDQVEHRAKWDIISLSLVVNFVPDLKQRGRMLSFAHNMLVPHGLLFLALPLPCVENSRYLTFELLEALMRSISFIEVQRKWRKGGKMAYWLYRNDGDINPVASETFNKKEVVREGKNRNNFCILL